MSIGAVVLALAPAAGGCGGGLPPAAEPADSPEPAARPAGRVSPIAGMPEGLAFDPVNRVLFAGLRNPGRLAMLDPTSGRTLGVVPLPASPRHLSLAENGDLLVPAEDADTLVRLSPRGRRKASVAVGEHPHDATEAAGRVFVSNEFGDSVSVIQGDRVIDTLDAPQQPGGIVASGDRYVGVVAVRARVLEAYDAETLSSLGRTDAGTGPTHAVSLGDSVLVADTDGGALLRFRLAPEPVLIGRTVLNGAPYGLAYDARHARVWVTLTARNRVVVLRIGRNGLRRVGSYPTVRQPNSVAVDRRTGAAFVAGRTPGEIERILPAGRGAPG